MSNRAGHSKQRCAVVIPIGGVEVLAPRKSRLEVRRVPAAESPAKAAACIPIRIEPSVVPLSERIFRGDLSAEAEMIAGFSQPMLRVIFPRVRNAHTADDLLHDSLLAALLVLRSRRLTEPGKLSNYLLRIARFQTTNHLRCKNAQMITQAEDNLDSLSDDRNPLLAYQEWQQHQLVRRLIGALGVVRDRRIATRFYLEEESKARICVELNISAANFDRIIYRVKQRLQKLAASADGVLNEAAVV